MKDKISVWMLIMHSSIYKVVILVFLTVAVQTGLYWRIFSQRVGGVSGLESIIEASGTKWILGASFLLLMVILCLTGCDFSSRTRYTMMRLPVEESTFCKVQCIYNVMCLVIFWSGQVLSILICCGLYLKFSDGTAMREQEIFLACYRNNLWHSLIPLADVTRTIRNVILVMSLGVTSAAVPVYQRQQHIPIVMIVLLGIVLLYFIVPMDNQKQDLLVSAAALFIMGKSVVGIGDCIKEDLV